MGSILFVTWDGGGNLPPALGIGSELRRRGHAVRFLGHAQQREGIEAAGFRFEAYTSAIRWSSAHQEPGLKGALRIVSVFSDAGPGEDLLASMRSLPADLVVLDCLMFGALEAAGWAGVRRAVLVHSF